jgi:hypothetical protein
MPDWEVTIVTDSNYIKKVRVDDCITRRDAEVAALGMTGGKRVITSNPKNYENHTEIIINNEITFNGVSYDYDIDEESEDGEIIVYLIPVFLLLMILWFFSPVISCIVGALFSFVLVQCYKK